ncbi:helix-turn-helix domain-containing protein [Oceanobacter mangrovi]|uniref:helix-turn-helix domain-containing protein n=1 Tax=Oceanobacter mangrovi TaxID=2862510 RepID=UPI001C8DF0B9|nr:helix-turn-helix domain-containing protein [Oceanobacter mangrovi]
MKARPVDKPQPIPVVHYYGEQQGAFTPDLMHCEALSVRSREHQFTIKPHRHHGLTQLFCLTRGKGEANIDGDSFEVEAPAVLVIAELCVHDFLWSEEVEGYVVSLSHSLLKQQPGQQAILQATRILQDQQACAELAEHFRGLWQEYVRPADEQRALALGSWLSLLVVSLQRWGQQADSETGQHSQSRASLHLQQYNQLINRDYSLQRSVESYASELGLTAPHLNSLCRQLLGKNALALVHERLLLEACRRLSYTIQPVSSIADQLGFNDPAYFTRFFKRQIGLSPKQYRQQSEV